MPIDTKVLFELFDHGGCQLPKQPAAQSLVKLHTAGHSLVQHMQHWLEPTSDTPHASPMQVAETCQLALQRIQHMQQQQQAAAAAAAAATSTDESPYMSVDPTPALPASTPISELREILLDESRRMFDRYSALFALRNKGGPEVVQVGITAACRACCHERTHSGFIAVSVAVACWQTLRAARTLRACFVREPITYADMHAHDAHGHTHHAALERLPCCCICCQHPLLPGPR